MTHGLGLGDAYGATLDRMKKQGEDKARLGISVLMWISHAERPLKTDELCHALAVEIGSLNLNTDNVPSVRSRPGARWSPAGGLPRAPDGTGRLAVVRPVLPKGRTAVFGWTAGDGASDLS